MRAFSSGRVLSFTSSKPKAAVKTPYSLFPLLCFLTTDGFDSFLISGSMVIGLVLLMFIFIF